MLFAAALTTSLRASGGTLPGPLPAAPAAAAPQAGAGGGDYVGPGSCSAVACHGAIRPVPGARILQTEYSTWVAMDRHARATEVLGNMVSQRMGRILGIGNPLQAQKCLVCHSLDVPAAARGRNFATEGVSCEACHGPATGWLGYHVTKDAKHEESVKRGMYDTKDVVKRAFGGILFIDEAYYLHRPENERDYGQEAIEVLLAVMESERQNLVVVMAGYKKPMEEFFQANPGMGSRVAHHISFPDYDVGELMQIAQLMVGGQGYELSEGAGEAFRDYIERRLERPRFAHGRSIRNAVERARMRQATRLFDSSGKLTKQDLITLEPDDILQSSVFSDTEDHAPVA